MIDFKLLGLLISAMILTLLITTIVNAQESTIVAEDNSASVQTLIINARIFNGVSEKLTDSMSIMIDGNKITRMSVTPIKPAAGTAIIDTK